MEYAGWLIDAGTEHERAIAGSGFAPSMGGRTNEPMVLRSGALVEIESLQAEIGRLRALVKRALPMADALDATKTAVVWTVDIQVSATALARDIRAALKA